MKSKALLCLCIGVLFSTFANSKDVELTSFANSLIYKYAADKYNYYNQKSDDWDIPRWKTYFSNKMNTLDPLEGIYVATIDMTISTLNGVEHYRASSKIVIYKESKRNRFNIRIPEGYDNRIKFKINETKVLCPLVNPITWFEKIGESNNYNFTLYLDGINQYAQVSQVDLFQIDFRVNLTSSFFEWYNYPNPSRCSGNITYSLTKEYPTKPMYERAIEEISKPSEWTGSGFAIGNGYIVTNYHVIAEANTINIKGIKGDENAAYAAIVVASDKNNDIAILKIDDAHFIGFGTIPYAVSTRLAEVGEEVYVLGYPLTQALGNEIKLTNGIISSRSGYHDDVSTYQITAPVQPGNSGGPMFDNTGNIIGIVNAGVPGAENVGYAIKTSYLKILIENAGLNISMTNNNTISKLSLSDKVKKIKTYVYYIKCSK